MCQCTRRKFVEAVERKRIEGSFAHVWIASQVPVGTPLEAAVDMLHWCAKCFTNFTWYRGNALATKARMNFVDPPGTQIPGSTSNLFFFFFIRGFKSTWHTSINTYTLSYLFQHFASFAAAKTAPLLDLPLSWWGYWFYSFRARKRQSPRRIWWLTFDL